MSLSNAERQRRHRDRLKAEAARPAARVFREACLAWLDDVEAELQADGADEHDIEQVRALRNEVLADEDYSLSFQIALGVHMEGRLRRVKVVKKAPRKRGVKAHETTQGTTTTAA